MIGSWKICVLVDGNTPSTFPASAFGPMREPIFAKNIRVGKKYRELKEKRALPNREE